MSSTQEAVVFIQLRVRKEDSAFVYAVLEAHEGICSYSTLDHVPGSLHRDLELQVPSGWTEEVDRVIQDLGDYVYVLTRTHSSLRI